MSRLIFAGLQRNSLMTSLMLLVVRLIFFMVVIRLLQIDGTFSGRTGEPMVAAASVVTSIPAVRCALLNRQRDFAAHPPAPAKGAVLDGRDIGSVVCPAADVKLFITATAEERARRRVEELRQAGAAAIFKDVLQDMKGRDTIHRERRTAPLGAG